MPKARVKAHGLGQAIFSATNLALGGSIDGVNFDALLKLKGLYGYVAGLMFKMSGSATQSAATAVLEHETLRNLASSFTVDFNGGNWCSAVSGRAVINTLIGMGLMDAQKADGLIHTADLANDTNAHAIDQTYLLPFAPNWFRKDRSGIECLAGAIPFENLKAGGAVAASILSSLGGDWALTSGTNLTVKIYPVVVYLDNPITFVRSGLGEKSSSASESTVELPGTGMRSVDFAAVFDDAYSSFTEATKPQVDVDGATIQRLVPSDTLQKYWIARADDDTGLIDDSWIIAGCEGAGVDGYLTGREIVVLEGHTDHGAAVYVAHWFKQPTAAEIEEDLRAQGVRSAAAISAEYASPTQGGSRLQDGNGVPYGFINPNGSGVANEVLSARPLVIDVA